LCAAEDDLRARSVSSKPLPLIINDLAYFQDDASKRNVGEFVKLHTQKFGDFKENLYLCTVQHIDITLRHITKEITKPRNSSKSEGLALCYNCGTHPMPLLQ
jgi:hypothetical protein